MIPLDVDLPNDSCTTVKSNDPVITSPGTIYITDFTPPALSSDKALGHDILSWKMFE